MTDSDRSSAVIFSDDPLVRVDRAVVESLKRAADQSPLGRHRLCAHRHMGEPVHEMIIAVRRGTYIRPHKHLGKVESAHVIEGLVDYVVFEEHGEIKEVFRMGSHDSGLSFFCRIPPSCYHAPMIVSDHLVFHETIRGPFEPSDTVHASWAPAEDDEQQSEPYRRSLESAIRNIAISRDASSDGRQDRR